VPPIRMIDTLGNAVDVPEDLAAAYADRGWRTATTTDALGAATAAANEDVYGGVGGALKAGLAAGARGLTLGLSDVAARAIGGEDTAIALEGLRAENQVISAGGEIAGALLPAAFTGGATAAGSVGRAAAFTPAALASRAGASVARLGAEAGTLGRVGAAAAGGAVEGVIGGVGAAASDVSLSSDPISVERIASSLSSNVLFGGGVGAAAGGAFAAAERGLVRAKTAVDNAMAKRAARATNTDEAIELGDLSILDTPTLRKARTAELENLQKQGLPQREAFVNDLREARSAAEKRQVYRAIEDAEDRGERTLAKSYLAADKRIDGLLRDRVTLAEHPERALGPLRAQQQALEAIEAKRVSEATDFEMGLRTARQDIRADIAAGKNADFDPKHLTDRGLDWAVDREILKRYGEGGLDAPLRPARLRYLDRVPDELAANRDLQQVLAGLTSAPVSDRLTKIDEALEALGAPQAPTLGDALGAVAPLAGPLGAAAAAGAGAIGRFRKAIDYATDRAGKATSAFLGPMVRGTKALGGAAPVIATKVLANARFAEEHGRDDTEDASDVKGSHATQLARLFKKRTDEIKSQTAYDLEGMPRLRPDARAKIADRLRPIIAADPMLADQLETAAAKRIEYLASLIPRRPDVFATRLGGPDRWQPSDMEMRAWARSVAAAEDPYGVLERASNGSITPEDIRVMRELYPEQLSAFTAEVAARLPELRESLPYPRRVALSLLTGEPVDPAMDPKVLAVLQAQYTYEPEQPRAEAKFGSVRSTDVEPFTPSQQRERGTEST
jgi:hypothetical protein